ncbi:MAG: type II toxin-antitoxin system RelE/ParE family toxin [Prevotellaceae bacterium]|nr:type II toxin-antitoxin system RelE/ParE family toxin [Prevotellaceae bacterium]
MYIEFDKEYLSDLYEKGKTSDKKHIYRPIVIKKYQIAVNILKSVMQIEDVISYYSLGYEELTGDKEGILSVRINPKYRLEFTVRNIEESELPVCRLLDICCNYKIEKQNGYR